MYPRNAGWFDYPALPPAAEARLDRIEKRDTQPPPLIDAIRARRERAVEVKETYEIEYLGLQTWVVQHPDEPDRCYLADMILRSCTCPDSRCFRVDGEQVDCKHIISVQPLWEALTARQATTREKTRPLPRYRPQKPVRIWPKATRSHRWIEGEFPRDKVKNCQLRWIGGSWDSPPSRKVTVQGVVIKEREQSSGWILGCDRDTINKLLAIYADREVVIPDELMGLGPFEPYTGEIGYDFGPMVHFRGEPSIEDVRSWPGGDVMADWLERRQAERRAERDAYWKEHPPQAVKVIVIGPHGKMPPPPDPYAD